MSKARCICMGCGNEGIHAVETNKRGGRNSFMCDFHYRNNMEYGTRNTAVTGVGKAHGVKIGVEFETIMSTKKARIEFMNMNAIPTHDSSLCNGSGGLEYGWERSCEYVFPTMNGLNAISKNAITIERLMNDEQVAIDGSCGTHLHVSTNGTVEHMDYVRRFINSLYMPVTEMMKRNPEATVALFGRNFTDYAPAMTWNYRCREGHNNTRYMWVNATNSNRIEYRLVKFQTAKQYMTCVKACVEMTKAIDTNFIQHFDDEITDTRRYDSKKVYRKHKADTASKKLCKIFQKACKELGYDVQ